MDVNSVKTSEQDESFLFINEAVSSLNKAVSKLKSINSSDKFDSSEKSESNNFPQGFLIKIHFIVTQQWIRLKHQ